MNAGVLVLEMSVLNGIPGEGVQDFGAQVFPDLLRAQSTPLRLPDVERREAVVDRHPATICSTVRAAFGDRVIEERRETVILARAPFRISLGGGGTDLPSYYGRFSGFVITAAINKYLYSTSTARPPTI